MSPAVLWLIIGLVLMVAELLLPGVWLIWMGISALAVGVLGMAVTLAGWQQAVVFVVVLAAIMAVIWRRGGRRGPHEDPVNAPGIGTVGRQVEAISFDGEQGRVRLGDSDWQARMAPGEAAPAPGTHLRVVAVEGITLVVRPD